MNPIDYFYIRQKVGRKHTYAVWVGDHLTFCTYVCGFPSEEGAKAFCKQKNAEERQKAKATQHLYR